mmetsp:Transcript_14421/g.23642  ORF Transcript_14421/g.23642 Transcript_14421/m.23642 type:complete len:217 (-) Transcript_14421:629-1279(-)
MALHQTSLLGGHRCQDRLRIEGGLEVPRLAILWACNLLCRLAANPNRCRCCQTSSRKTSHAMLRGKLPSGHVQIFLAYLLLKCDRGRHRGPMLNSIRQQQLEIFATPAYVPSQFANAVQKYGHATRSRNNDTNAPQSICLYVAADLPGPKFLQSWEGTVGKQVVRLSRDLLSCLHVLWRLSPFGKNHRVHQLAHSPMARCTQLLQLLLDTSNSDVQ